LCGLRGLRGVGLGLAYDGDVHVCAGHRLLDCVALWSWGGAGLAVVYNGG
jgi:hypothetical protein